MGYRGIRSQPQTQIAGLPGRLLASVTRPPDAKAWDKSIAAFHTDRKKLVAALEKAELLAAIPFANDQSLASKTILVIDHNSHHLGQLILLRRLLNIWPAKS